MTTSNNRLQRVVQRVKASDKEWQPVVFSANFSQIRKEPTTTHPKENYLNVEEDLEEDLVCDTYNFKTLWR